MVQFTLSTISATIVVLLSAQTCKIRIQHEPRIICTSVENRMLFECISHRVLCYYNKHIDNDVVFGISSIMTVDVREN